MGRNRKPSREVAAPAASVESVSKRINTTLEDALWSMSTQGLIYDGEYVVRDNLADEAFRDGMRYLGLNPDRPRDVEIIAAAIGIFGEEESDIYVRPADAQYDMGIISMSMAAEAQRGFKVLPDKVVVENVSFAKGLTPSDNIGYAMLVRQAWALRKIGERLGKPVVVSTSALSDDDYWKGVQVWPKMGYNFPLTGIIRERAMANGFQARNTPELMTEVNAAGETGYDAWGRIVSEALKYMPDKELRIRGSMTVTDDNDTGLQVLLNYGRQKGILE